jgi:hypothetical protein
MNAMTTFTSDKEPLYDLLKDIRRGKIQLPDFQRGWIWDDAHIASLLASISMSYPVGAVMMLETGNPDVRFKPRLVEGVKVVNPGEPERFILDGQQRLTSLYQALMLDEPVSTLDSRKRQVERWYYLDMVKVLDTKVDREDAILALPADRILRNFRNEVIADYSTPDSEYQHCLFPVRCVFDCADWRTGFNQYWQYSGEKSRLFDDFERHIIKRFEQYMVPVIKLFKTTPKEAVCQVFEKVNTGGVSLTVFELLTATYAADEFNLRDDWAGRRATFKNSRLGTVSRLLNTVQNDDLLQAITLLSTHARRNEAIRQGVAPDQAPGISCKRKDILKLTLADYQMWADTATEGFVKAGRMLYGQKIFNARDLPYRTQLIPLTAILTVLGKRADAVDAKEKILRWYWCGVLGELYGGAIESRFAFDLPEVVAWVDGGDEPRTVTEASFLRSRLYTLQTRNSAAYKGIYALLMRDGGLDFITGDPITEQAYFDDKIDIHHIFPAAWCKARKLDKRRWNSIINKTAISAKTNRIIGSKGPSDYIPVVLKRGGITIQQMGGVLASHAVEAQYLHADDFDGCIQAREKALLDRIEKVMGKAADRQTEEQWSDDVDELEEEAA